MKSHWILILPLAIAAFAALPAMAQTHLLADAADTPTVEASAPQLDLGYTRPTQAMKIRAWRFDTIGPYPIAGAVAVAGFSQMENTPPQWKQGLAGYSRRFGSDLGIAAISTTTRYALAEAFKEDTVYYHCECKGIMPRLGHALVSTVTARHGQDGHRVFSPSAFIAPYAGAATGVYAWYPSNYGAKYALRLGNYNLLGTLGENILMEFFYGSPHALISRLHTSETPVAQTPDPK